MTRELSELYIRIQRLFMMKLGTLEHKINVKVIVGFIKCGGGGRWEREFGGFFIPR